ncbi:MAG: SDR family oxidoreductase [Magnetococcales bacterium]|nr:SDR family oxidoreductase [Magnetococcales bacterium]
MNDHPSDSENEHTSERPSIQNKGSVFGGLKFAFALFLAAPFIVVLAPLWFIYRWDERRKGRPDPESPWQIILRSRRNRFEILPAGSSSVDHKTALPRPDAVETSSSQSPPQTTEHSPSERLHVYDAGTLHNDGTLPGEGRVALVTGAGHRIGAGIVRALVADGYGVVIHYNTSHTSAETLAEEMQTLGGSVTAIQADLSNPSEATSLINRSLRHFDRLDLLVNNASLFTPTGVDTASWEAMEQQFRVNTLGPLWLALKSAPHLGKQSGSIINIADIWGKRPLAGYVAYSATQAALMQATRGLARDLAPDVRVNAVAPGVVLSPDDSMMVDSFQRALRRTPLARQSNPESVVQAVRFLAHTPFVTGEVIRVDGGRSLV